MQPVALVSTPWPIFSRPSIQLGVLKAYLQRMIPDLDVHAYHFFLRIAREIGYDLYADISRKTWSAESLYASLLYPETVVNAEKILRKDADRVTPSLLTMDFQGTAEKIRTLTDTFIESIIQHGFLLIGFSVSLCQMTSALYFIRKIKEQRPDMVTVVGGSTFIANDSRQFFKCFPDIDIVVQGEGEQSLYHLIRALQACRDPSQMEAIPGVFNRYRPDECTGTCFAQLPSLHELPVPDYEDYFQLLKTFPATHTFFPTIPAEMSRGCVRHVHKSGKRTGCAFCNLNLQWSGYRFKSSTQVINEIDHLTSRHQVLSVAFADNLVPVKPSRDIFSGLSDSGKNLKLFCETRATTSKNTLAAMRSAGMEEVQIGIEALSTSLLKKMNKGTTAIQNLEIMKNCETLGIRNKANIIFHFPSSDANDIDETLRSLEFAVRFRPLKIVHFWLGYGSTIYENPKDYGIKAVFNHPNYRKLFPPEIALSCQFIIQSYRGDIQFQKKLWKPVKQKILEWKSLYETLQSDHSSTPVLTFRDGREFLIIREKQLKKKPAIHRLTGTSRSIYLFCQTHRSIAAIARAHPKFSEKQIIGFLRMMVEKRLMFNEKDRYLSLASHLTT